MNTLRAKDETASVTRLQRVAAGLFVLRYSASAGGLRAPAVAVDAEPLSGVTILSESNAARTMLYAPGDAVVVHALRDAHIRISVLPRTAASSTDAQLVLERVSCSVPTEAAFEEKTPAVAPSSVPTTGELAVLAHVSRRGDVTARAGQWICGPDAPLAIEGLELVWPDKPEGVDILTAAVINMRGRRVQPPAKIGQFVGTRQKAAPIVGLTLNLTGALAHRYVLQVEALFLGGSLVSRTGVFVELAGDTGFEPLVGLKLSVTEQGARQDAAPAAFQFPTAQTMDSGFAAPAAASPVLAPATNSKREEPPASTGRVRVFRMPRRSNPSPIAID
ncbi:MAG: hypothetical protein LCH39_04685 [Proteobacteria bacterium]|nr:hypothetical protein [Pseudomonadota bacterium]